MELELVLISNVRQPWYCWSTYTFETIAVLFFPEEGRHVHMSHRFYTENLFWQGSDKTYIPIKSFPCAKSSGVQYINPMVWWRYTHSIGDLITWWRTCTIKNWNRYTAWNHPTITNEEIVIVIHSACIYRKGVAMTVTCQGKSTVCVRLRWLQ